MIGPTPSRRTQSAWRKYAVGYSSCRDLRRKYGDTLADVLGYHDEVDARLAELEGYEQRVMELEKERLGALGDEAAAAATVGSVRRGGAGSLAAEVQVHLRQLAMDHAEVAVVVGDTDPGDEVAFLLAANPGAPLLPLARVASGGELGSRHAGPPVGAQ